MLFTVVQGGPPKLNISSPVALCKGATLDLTAPAMTAGNDAGLTYSYWADTAALQPLANPSAVAAAGTYYIKATASAGCFTLRPVLVSLVDQPQTPVITAGGPVQVCQGVSVVLRSSAAANCQWYRANAVIAGAANQTPGCYVVQIVTPENADGLQRMILKQQQHRGRFANLQTRMNP